MILYCTIVDISGPPSFVFWYRDADVVNYSEQTGVSIITNHEAPNTDLNADFPPSPLENPNIGEESLVPERILVSTLRIDTVRPKDAGTYTCAPSNARNHSVVVHVIKGQFLFLTLDLIFISFDNKISSGAYIAIHCQNSTFLLSINYRTCWYTLYICA